MSILPFLSGGNITYGVKVSKPTKSISSTDPRDFVLHSEYGSVVIYKENEVSVTIASGGTTMSTVNYYEADGTTPKTFSYIPVVYIMVELNAGSGQWYSSPFTFTESMDIDSPQETGIYSNFSIYTAVENSKFFITFYNRSGSSKTIKYHYYILANLAV